MNKAIQILLVPTAFLALAVVYHSIGRLPELVFNDRIAMVANLYFISLIYIAFRHKATSIFWAILCFGLVMNNTVVLANGGMPNNHVALTETTRYIFLADIIPIGRLFIISAGDILIVLGLSGLIGTVAYDVYDLIERTSRIRVKA